MSNPEDNNKYNQLFSQAKSAIADSDTGMLPASPAVTQPTRSSERSTRKITQPRQTSLIKRIGRQAIILVGLTLLTVAVLYWQTIYNEVNYWWRHLQDTPSSGSIPNALYVGNKAFYELENDEHPTAPITPIDNRLVIDKIEINAPIVLMESREEDAVLKAIEEGVGHYPDTALPGEPGNVFLTGHSSYWWWNPGQYKFVFQHLEDLVIGDTVTIYYNQQRYDYKVREMQVIKPTGNDANHVFDQDPYLNDPILRIMTCVPVGTSLNRLIVTAEQISPDPLNVSTSTPEPESLPILN